jgi:uncharacterized protein
MIKITDKIINQIVANIVRIVSPEEVVLFGSQAKGKAGPNSDIDFLVVVSGSFDEKRTKLDMYTNLINKLDHRNVPVDILLFTKSDVREWKPYINHVISRAYREGKILYERKKVRANSPAKGKK